MMIQTKIYSEDTVGNSVSGLTSCLAPYVKIDNAVIVEQAVDMLTRDIFPRDLCRLRLRLEGVTYDGKILSLVDVLKYIDGKGSHTVK